MNDTKAMKLDFKLIAIIVLIQIITGSLVFALTRAYYIDRSPASRQSTESGTREPDALSTEEIIQGLQRYSEPSTPTDPEQLNREANLAFQQADYARAASLYQRLLEQVPDDASTHNNLGLTLHYLGRSTQALEILQRGAELQPDFQRIWLTLGFVNSRNGHIEAAREAFTRAIELGPETGPGESAREMLQKLP